MKAKPIPPRLFVLFAREAPVGVIFRRGPKRWVQLIHWNTANDVFTLGQWFHGNIYADRSDVSPNGKLLIYFAAKHPSSTTWTAISKPPYFTALNIWVDLGTYGGGGLFHDNESIQLGYHRGLSEVFPMRLEGDDRYRIPAATNIYSVWEEHLIRGGWKSIQRYNFEETSDNEYKETPAILQRTIDFYSLRIESPYNIQTAKYTLVHNRGTDERPLKVTWAGVDQRNRLVYAKDGKIYSGRVDGDFKLFRRELADFNDSNTPDPKPSPDWAKRW